MMPHTGYRPVPPAELTASLNAQILLVAMIETPEAAENADAIAAVDGIDVLMIGTNDLTTVMRIPGEYEHPSVDRAFAAVVDACRRHAKVAGFGGVPAAAVAKRRIEQGMRFVLAGNDLSCMVAGARAALQALR
jgi:2-keto-3-deoxy-L-rhamnonate aldolase RhmA